MLINKISKKTLITNEIFSIELILLLVPIFISLFLNWIEYGVKLDASSYDKWMDIYSSYFGVIFAVYTFRWRQKINAKKENTIMRSRELNIINSEIRNFEKFASILIEDIKFLRDKNKELKKEQEGGTINNVIIEPNNKNDNKEIYTGCLKDQKNNIAELFDKSFEKIDKLRILGNNIENSTYIYNSFNLEEEKFVCELKETLDINNCIGSLQYKIVEIYDNACMLCHIYCDPYSTDKYDKIYLVLKSDIKYSLEKIFEYNKILINYLDLGVRKENNINEIIINFKNCINKIEKKRKTTADNYYESK